MDGKVGGYPRFQFTIILLSHTITFLFIHRKSGWPPAPYECCPFFSSFFVMNGMSCIDLSFIKHQINTSE
jgi:hypothetical protein